MITLIIGLPRSGKTTEMAKLIQRNKKKYPKIYSNVPIKNSYLVDSTDLGHYQISDGLLLIDEAGIEFNNRSYKSFSKELIYFMKMHGHYKLDIIFFSQSFDVDKVIRNLAEKVYVIKKLFFFTFKWSCKMHWTTNSDGEPTIVYEMPKLPRGITFRPRYYKYFNSYDRIELPVKEFKFIE